MLGPRRLCQTIVALGCLWHAAGIAEAAGGAIQHREEQRDEHAGGVVGGQRLVDARQHLFGPGRQPRNAADHGERHHHEQRGRDALARHVSEHEREPPVVETEHVVEVAAHRARGLQIGSGTIESACKQLVSTRLKLAGIIWDAEGAEAVAVVRAWLKSERWDEAMRLRPPLQRTYRRQTTSPSAVAAAG